MGRGGAPALAPATARRTRHCLHPGGPEPGRAAAGRPGSRVLLGGTGRCPARWRSRLLRPFAQGPAGVPGTRASSSRPSRPGRIRGTSSSGAATCPNGWRREKLSGWARRRSAARETWRTFSPGHCRHEPSPTMDLLPVRGAVDADSPGCAYRERQPEALDGVVLALAGLARLWNDPAGRAIVEPLLGDVRWMVLPLTKCPAAGPGVLAIECRAVDEVTRELLRGLHDPETAELVAVEDPPCLPAMRRDRSALGVTAVPHGELGPVSASCAGPHRPESSNASTGSDRPRRRALPFRRHRLATRLHPAAGGTTGATGANGGGVRRVLACARLPRTSGQRPSLGQRGGKLAAPCRAGRVGGRLRRQPGIRRVRTTLACPVLGYRPWGSGRRSPTAGPPLAGASRASAK